MRPRARSGGGPGPAGRTPAGRPEWVLLSAVLGLLGFYYFARADVIGVASAARGWVPMTGPAVPPWRHFLSAALLLGALPVAVARGVTRRPLGALGLGVGRWREGLRWVALGVPLACAAAWIAAGDPAMRAVYPLYPRVGSTAPGFAAYALLQLLYYGAWEVLFRGVLLFGLERHIGGRAANLVQTALSVTAHFGRALPETAAALPAGLVFGAVALRTRSVWYGAAIHWTVGVTMDGLILRGAGI